LSLKAPYEEFAVQACRTVVLVEDEQLQREATTALLVDAIGGVEPGFLAPASGLFLVTAERGAAH